MNMKEFIRRVQSQMDDDNSNGRVFIANESEGTLLDVSTLVYGGYGVDGWIIETADTWHSPRTDENTLEESEVFTTDTGGKIVKVDGKVYRLIGDTLEFGHRFGHRDFTWREMDKNGPRGQKIMQAFNIEPDEDEECIECDGRGTDDWGETCTRCGGNRDLDEGKRDSNFESTDAIDQLKADLNRFR
jgi:predicted heme/steroid binding protein